MTPQTWCQRVKPVSRRDRIPSPPAPPPHFLKLLEQWQHCCAGPPGERQSSRVLGRSKHRRENRRLLLLTLEKKNPGPMRPRWRGPPLGHAAPCRPGGTHPGGPTRHPGAGRHEPTATLLPLYGHETREARLAWGTGAASLVTPWDGSLAPLSS